MAPQFRIYIRNNHLAERLKDKSIPIRINIDGGGLLYVEAGDQFAPVVSRIPNSYISEVTLLEPILGKEMPQGEYEHGKARIVIRRRSWTATWSPLVVSLTAPSVEEATAAFSELLSGNLAPTKKYVDK